MALSYYCLRSIFRAAGLHRRFMLNNRFDQLPEYAFPRLAALLEGLKPGTTGAESPPIIASLGEPQHPFPTFVTDILTREQHLYAKYPPINGTEEFRLAVADWLTRRYQLDPDLVMPDQHILPLSGTREGLYMVAQIAVPQSKAGTQPAILIPNPFYQCYAAAAAGAGAEAVYLPALQENGFLPDYAAQDGALLDRTAMAYLCSPANPQGTMATLDYLVELIRLARERDFVLVLDECYAEIYDDSPPAGGLEACQKILADPACHGEADPDNPFANVLVFHSLSKRSNLPGLRSGFVAGDKKLIARFRQLRSYGGCPSPLPVYAAAAAAWRDEDHVAENRTLYRAKNDIAEEILGNRFGFFRPPGGFFLWLDVGDGVEATKTLWTKAGIKVLPGRFLAKSSGDNDAEDQNNNPGDKYIRVALVHDLETTREALRRIAQTL